MSPYHPQGVPSGTTYYRFVVCWTQSGSQLMRQEVAIAAGAPATHKRRNELQEIAWKTIAQAEE